MIVLSNLIYIFYCNYFFGKTIFVFKYSILNIIILVRKGEHALRKDLYYSCVRKWFLFSIIFIFLLGTLFHFVFGFTGKVITLAPFFPVNESTFEHLKLTVYPILLGQLIGYLILKNRTRIVFTNWFISIAISIITSSFFTLSLYYIATNAFNIHSTIVDISIYFISIVFGQVLGLHLYNKYEDNKKLFLFSIIIILFILIFFTFFTFFPPKLPLFIESSTGLYGI